LNNVDNKIHYEDEIDLRELFNTIYQYKRFILIFTSFCIFMSLIYIYISNPIYKVKSYVQIGYIGSKLIVEPEVLEKELRIIFNVDDKNLKKNEFKTKVNNISITKNASNFIEISTTSINNDKAIKKQKEIINYIKESRYIVINNYERNILESISKREKEIKLVNNIEIPKINREILKIKTQFFLDIDNEINILKNIKIKNLFRKIKLIKQQDVKLIEQKIKFYLNKIDTLKEKIKFYKLKLKEYAKEISNINKENSDNTIIMISSIQMLNYQNLILNAQNNIQNLLLEINNIETQTIPNLKIKKSKLLDVSIQDLNKQIDHIKKIEIPKLLRKKENLLKDRIKDLENERDITLAERKLNLKNEIKDLKYKLNSAYFQNSKKVGEFIISNKPIKPKKNLILIISFITGLIISIFSVFIYRFFKQINIINLKKNNI